MFHRDLRCVVGVLIVAAAALPEVDAVWFDAADGWFDDVEEICFSEAGFFFASLCFDQFAG